MSVEEAIIAEETVAEPKVSTIILEVAREAPSTDLNNDGRQTITDVSIFMLNMFGNNLRFDFNVDGVINATDMSIIMSAK